MSLNCCAFGVKLMCVCDYSNTRVHVRYIAAFAAIVYKIRCDVMRPVVLLAVAGQLIEQVRQQKHYQKRPDSPKNLGPMFLKYQASYDAVCLLYIGAAMQQKYEV